ncbi:MAG: Vms1/Ankzf1 family peptidyl-tRNA hydrolase [Actinomycetota bacterium]
MNVDLLTQRLQSLEELSGPFVSLYLDTSADSELAPHKIELRWRELRGQSPADDIPEKSWLFLDDVVAGAHRAGRGLVAITSGEELAFRQSLYTPIRDEVRVGSLPHLLPFFDWVQDRPTYAVVVVDRTGGEIHVVGGLDDDATVEITGDHDEIRKVQPGGWSQRRFQNRAEDSWERNAEEVAARLTKMMREEALPLAVALGDVRARSFLRENCPPDIQRLLFELDVDSNHRDDLEDNKEDIEAAVAGIAGQKIEDTLERFLEERGQADLAAEGLEATFAALRMGQVESLLIRRTGLEPAAWYSRSDMSQGATDRGTLDDIGINDVASARADEVLVRLALGTGAAICAIPELSGDKGPAEGVGAILRFKTDGG